MMAEAVQVGVTQGEAAQGEAAHQEVTLHRFSIKSECDCS